MKVLLREQFKYQMSVPCPHDGAALRKWLNENDIPFVYSTANAGKSIEYFLTDLSHVAWFKLNKTFYSNL